MKLQKGFTLIELLVVIAIIGILATIVLSSLGSSRGRGNDTKIKGQLSAMRSQAPLWFPNPISLVTTTNVSQAGTSAAMTSTVTSGSVNMFNDGTAGSNSLFSLVSNLPTNTFYAYYEEVSSTAGTLLPLNGAKWSFAAGLTTGAFCVDYNGSSVEYKGAQVATTTTMTTAFPNLATYNCH